jgi:hypothetical protein
MQRALALLVKAYERRTGLSAETVWDAVSESELAERDRTPSKNSNESAASAQDANNVVDSEQRKNEPAPSAEQTRPSSKESSSESRARGAFTYWLRKTQ